PLAVGPVQCQRVVDAVRLLGGHRDPRHDEPDPVTTAGSTTRSCPSRSTSTSRDGSRCSVTGYGYHTEATQAGERCRHPAISRSADPIAKYNISSPVARSTKIVHQRLAAPSRPRWRRAFDEAQMTPQVSAPAITAAAMMSSEPARAPASSGLPMAASQKATFHGLVSAIAAPRPKPPRAEANFCG